MQIYAHATMKFDVLKSFGYSSNQRRLRLSLTCDTTLSLLLIRLGNLNLFRVRGATAASRCKKSVPTASLRLTTGTTVHGFRIYPCVPQHAESSQAVCCITDKFQHPNAEHCRLLRYFSSTLIGHRVSECARQTNRNTYSAVEGGVKNKLGKNPANHIRCSSPTFVVHA